jgi:hypothetical protein
MTRNFFRLVVIDRSERNKVLKDIATIPRFEGTILRTYTGTLYTNQVNFNKIEDRVISLMCKEIFNSFHVVLYVPKNFYLIEALDKKIEILQAAGLIDHWHSQIIDPRFLKIVESKEPKRIKLEMLAGCFYTWGIGGVLSLAVFFGEVVMGKLRRKKKRVGVKKEASLGLNEA